MQPIVNPDAKIKEHTGIDGEAFPLLELDYSLVAKSYLFQLRDRLIKFNEVASVEERYENMKMLEHINSILLGARKDTTAPMTEAILANPLEWENFERQPTREHAVFVALKLCYGLSVAVTVYKAIKKKLKLPDDPNPPPAPPGWDSVEG